MTKFQRHLHTLGWTHEYTADRLGIQRSSVQRWANGAYSVPGHVAAWVERLADLAARGQLSDFDDSLPEGWSAIPEGNNVRIRA